jgi:hypothetical protein
MVVAGAALALCFGAAEGGSAAETSLPLVEQTINLPGFPTALCNDGTLPVFYYQPGSGDDRNKWVILFQDGSGCTTDAACTTRGRGNRYFISGIGPDIPSTTIPDGILSTLPAVNPDFAHFNHVFLHYCSSDGYAGDTERVIDGTTWQFRGKVIVDALIEQLLTTSIDGRPTLAAATEVLIAGSSSGAMGVHNNLDRIAARLAPISVKGIADSAWVPPGIIPFQFGTFAARPDQALAYAYFKARPDDSCVAANPKNPGGCLNEAFAFPFIATPMFVYADQRDTNILGMLGIAHSPTSDDEADYVTGYAARVRDTIRDEVPAYFAANVTIHNVLLWAQYAKVSEGGETLGGTLHRWYFGEPGDARVMAPGPGNPPLSLSR